MPKIHVYQEGARGCGFRKEGGLYLVSEPKTLSECHRLPAETSVCQACGQGFKPSRALSWVNPEALVGPPCEDTDTEQELSEECPCVLCPVCMGVNGKVLLVWAGERHYPQPHDLLAEAQAMGFSRRIAGVPRGFKPGETWVFLAHRKAVQKNCDRCDGKGFLEEALDESLIPTCPKCMGMKVLEKPGVFYAFLPSRVEYVVGHEDLKNPKKLARMERRGITLVQVVPSEERQTKKKLYEYELSETKDEKTLDGQLDLLHSDSPTQEEPNG